MIVICCGMYRAASTWQYNVACHLVERFRAGTRLGYLFDGAGLREHIQGAADVPAWAVAKAHEPDPLFADLITSGRARALYSYRDIRDVAYSVAHKRGSTFEREVEGTDLLAQTVRNFRFWTAQPHTLVQRYERITAESAAGVQEVADFLDIALPPGALKELAETYSLDNNRARTARIAADLRARGVDLSDPANALCRDEATQLHWNHIRDGRAGGWRALANSRHLAVLARGCGAWLIEQEYESDWAWAHPALEYLLFEEHAAQRHELNEAHAHLDAHRQSLAALHEHLASERTRSAARAEEVADLREHLEAHRASLAALHGHLASERARSAARAEEVIDLCRELTARRTALVSGRECVARSIDFVTRLLRRIKTAPPAK